MSMSSNPFAALAGTFPGAKKKRAAGPDRQAGGSGPAHSSSAQKRRGKKTDTDQGEDAALFLDAMSSIKPLQADKARSGEEGDMAAALKGVQPLSSAKGKAKSGPATLAPAPQGHELPDAGLAQAGKSTPGTIDSAAAKPDTLFSLLDLHAQPGMDAGQADATGQARDAADGQFRDIPERAFIIQAGPKPAEEDLFGKAMQGVAPIAAKGREITPPSAASPAKVPPADPAKGLRDLLEGRVEFALYHSDEYMEGHVVGVDPPILGRLRAGQLSPEAHLDLHGQNARQALDALTGFIKNAYQRNLRTVTVVTGRGKNSPGGIGVLRPMLQEWLTREPFKRVVLAFCTAQPADGGPGAVYVLLRKYKKSRGKIVWESAPPDADSNC